MSIRSALFFGTGAFVFVALPSYWTNLDAVHSLIYGVGIFFIMSLIGFQIGNILAHPKGHSGRIKRFLRELFTLAPENKIINTPVLEAPHYDFHEPDRPIDFLKTEEEEEEEEEILPLSEEPS